MISHHLDSCVRDVLEALLIRLQVAGLEELEQCCRPNRSESQKMTSLVVLDFSVTSLGGESSWIIAVVCRHLYIDYIVSNYILAQFTWFFAAVVVQYLSIPTSLPCWMTRASKPGIGKCLQIMRPSESWSSWWCGWLKCAETGDPDIVSTGRTQKLFRTYTQRMHRRLSSLT